MKMVVCTECGSQNKPSSRFCLQCGAAIEQDGAPASAPGTSAKPSFAAVREQVRAAAGAAARSARQSTGPASTSYAALRGIANLCRLLAWGMAGLIALGGALTTLISLVGGEILAALGALIGAALSAAVTYIFWRILAESISVMLDVETNTRHTAAMLEQVAALLEE